ncbi:Resolvase, N terminal domain [Paenibacillus sp. 1_12]|uniref:hypothetical protein n=1 Tax=Paenibacillus sp. 1_12 TaxID=1566278 RepID=UPI0008E27C67|nr:hypothetical protein [Paenibacillus sp. 1_12]SFM05133.1 Resolvase, N terminal domain [Paenibacillus sp. 1_12]
MAKLAYIRAQRKQEIEQFEVRAQADMLYIDLSDGFGITLGDSLGSLLDQLGNGDKVIIRQLSEIADTVSELRSFLSTLRNNNAELVLLDSVSNGVLSEEGYKTLAFVENFIKEKDKVKQERRNIPGRPVQTYPLNFLNVYTSHRNIEFNGLEAAKKLSINYKTYRELVKVFESKV